MTGFFRQVQRLALLYILAYSVLALWLGSGLSLTWDEGAHAVSGVFLHDLAADFVAGPPASLSGPWLHDYAYAYFSHYFSVLSSGFNYPPAYALVTAVFYFLFGVNEVAARLVAVGFTALTLLFVYLLGRRLYDVKTGLAAMVFLSLSPVFVKLSLSVLRDIPVLFFFLASLHFFHQSMQAAEPRQARRHALAASALIVFGTLIKYNTLLVYPVLGAYLLVTRQLRSFPSGPRFKPLAAGLAILLLYFAAYLGFAWSFPPGSTERATLQASILDWFTPGSERLAPAYSAGLSPLQTALYYPLALLSAFGLPLFLLGLLGLWMAWQFGKDRDKLLLSVVGLQLLVFTFIQNKEPRFVLPLLVFFVYAAIQALRSLTARLSAPWQKAAAWSVVALFVAVPLIHPLSASDDSLPAFLAARSSVDLDAVARYAAANLEPDAVFVFASHDNRVNWVNFSFYLLKYDRLHSRRVEEFPAEAFDARVQALQEQGLPVYVVRFSEDTGELSRKTAADASFPLVHAFSQPGQAVIELRKVRG